MLAAGAGGAILAACGQDNSAPPTVAATAAPTLATTTHRSRYRRYRTGCNHRGDRSYRPRRDHCGDRSYRTGCNHRGKQPRRYTRQHERERRYDRAGSRLRTCRDHRGEQPCCRNQWQVPLDSRWRVRRVRYAAAAL